MRLIPITLAAVLAACATPSARHARAVYPAEDEGDLLVQLLPFKDVSGLSFELVGIAVVRSDAVELPLEIEVPRLSAPVLAASRLIARGRLAPGQYSALVLRFDKATLSTGGAPADLLTPQQPIRVELPFRIGSRQAVVVALSFAPSTSVVHGVTFDPQFAAQIPPRTVPGLLGLCTDRARHLVAVFDKRSRELTSALPTGAEPWGVAVDSLRQRAYVALAGADAVQVFDLQNGVPLTTIPLSAGDQPRELALTPDARRIVVLNHRSNSLAVLDAESMVEVARTETVPAPEHLLIDSAGARVYVTSGRNNQLAVVDLAQVTTITTLPTEDVPLRPQLDREGKRLYVAFASSPYLATYTLPDLAPANRAFVGMGVSSIALDARTQLLHVAYRTTPRLAVLDAFSLIPVEYVDAPAGTTWMAIDDAENALFLVSDERREVTVVDLSSRRTLTAFEVAAEPRVLVLEGERR